MSIVVEFDFEWKLLLDPDHEHDPYVHFYLSTIFSSQVIEWKLPSATGNAHHRLEFRIASRNITVASFLRGCALNLDFFVLTANNYREPVSNPGGSVLIHSHELSSHSSSVHKSIELYMIADVNQRSKGEVHLAQIAIAVRGVVVTEKDIDSAEIDRIAERRAKTQRICASYIEVTDTLYESVRPTMESVAAINSSTWVSRVETVLPPLAYVVDVVCPMITEEYYINCMDIVLRRMALTHAGVMKLDLSGTNPADVRILGSIVGQLLCCYPVHVSYRSDFVYVFDTLHHRFLKVMTENFGDMTVDQTGDCEDSGRLLVRLHQKLLRFDGHTNDPTLQHLIEYCKCFCPFLVLLGVSSAQINAMPKDIMHMGAHENCFLIPWAKFSRHMERSDPSGCGWKKQLLKMYPKLEPYWERSAKYQTLVLEGTGCLEPCASHETHIKARIILETFMQSEDLFYALRRTFYYSEENTSFYKTVEKLFTPVPLLRGGSFGSFLAMHRDNARASLREGLTKSIGFGEFLSDSCNICMLAEPEFTAAEKLAIFESMKDIHPPRVMHVCLDKATCWSHQEKLVTDLVAALPGKNIAATIPMVYYLRAGKIDKPTCDEIDRFARSLVAQSMLAKVEAHPEFVTDTVGGYRFVFHLDRDVIEAYWTKHARTLEKKLGTK